MVKPKKIKVVSFFLLLISFGTIVLGKALPAYAATPQGCPGGPTGQAAPGTICPDGSIPVGDPTLPLFCPGSTKAGAVSDTYTISCPARPGRADCTYSQATSKCVTASGQDITQGDSGGTSSPPAPPCNSSADPAICNNVIVSGYINPAINFLSAGIGIIVAIMIIVGGIQYTTAGGDAQKVAAAKKRITNAIFSLLAFAFMYAFLQFLVPGGLFK